MVGLVIVVVLLVVYSSCYVSGTLSQIEEEMEKAKLERKD